MAFDVLRAAATVDDRELLVVLAKLGQHRIAVGMKALDVGSTRSGRIVTSPTSVVASRRTRPFPRGLRRW